MSENIVGVTSIEINYVVREGFMEESEPKQKMNKHI
jgi:hypothetical protein